MKNTKYHIYPNSEERCLLISNLNDLRNRLIAEGKYTQQGDYLLPDLKLPEQPKVKNGIWGCGSPVETSAAGRSADRADRRDSV